MAMVTAVEQHFGYNKVPANLNNAIRKLCYDLSLLRQTYSAMAERNLLNDVLRDLAAIDRLLPANPANLKTACADAKKQITGLINGWNVGNARYDAVLCLGYRFKTAASTYRGKLDDWQDMKSKCDDLKQAIRSAHRLADPYNRESRILKLFMAPEFYFRGRNGAYDYDVIMGIKAQGRFFKSGGQKGIMDLMGEEVDKSIYKHWLFVMGTAIAGTLTTVCDDCGGEMKWEKIPGTNNTRQVCKANRNHIGTKDGAKIDNFAFVRKEKQDYIVSKELISQLDFIQDDRQNITDRVTIKDRNLNADRNVPVLKSDEGAADNQPSKFQDERMGGSIFTVDGVTFGLEICLDHAASLRSNNQGRLDHAANIQVQLIPSAAMNIRQFRTVDGGIVFNVDGAAPHVDVYGQTVSDAGPSRFEHRRNEGGDDTYAYSRVNGWSPTRNVAPNLRLGAAADGAVLMYGPYELPSTMPA